MGGGGCRRGGGGGGGRGGCVSVPPQRALGQQAPAAAAASSCPATGHRRARAHAHAHLERVRVPCDQDVHAQLPLQDGQRLLVAPRRHLVAVAHAHPEVCNLQHLRAAPPAAAHAGAAGLGTHLARML
jgi:hypothetical protein